MGGCSTMPEIEGPFTEEVLIAGWATAGVTANGLVVLVLASAKDGERLTFVMEPRLAAALNAMLPNAIALAGGNEEEKH